VQRQLIFEVGRIRFVELEFGELRAVDQPVLTGRKDVSETAGVVCAVRLGRHCGTSRCHRQRQACHTERDREQTPTARAYERACGAAVPKVLAERCPRRPSIQKRNPHPEPPRGCKLPGPARAAYTTGGAPRRGKPRI